MRKRTRLWTAIRRWFYAAAITYIVITAGPGLVSEMTSYPSVWDWVKFVVWLLVAISAPFAIASTWRHRHEPVDREWFPTTIPLTDIDDDVVRDIALRHDERIPAMRELRETYPGLGLKDARDLVERHR